MFKKPQYFFEPLVLEEFELIAKDKTELKWLKKIVFNHLLFVILSRTPSNLRPQTIKLIKEQLYSDRLLEQLSQLNPKLNLEIIEQALSFILTQVQTRLENATN